MERYAFLLIILLLYYSNQSTNKKVEDLFGDLYKGDIFSGYLKTNIEGNELFFVYTPSQNDPGKDPLLLWLNGGPGCSSLFGLFGEIGPVVFDNYSGKLKLNPYSWNKNANLLAIEQPGGVGFSTTNDTNFTWNDDIMAENLLTGLKDFFNQFEELKGRKFYISGESYAGVYVPYIATYILEDTSDDKIQLNGVLIGNGLTTFETDVEKSMVDFGYYHGIISYRTYKDYQKYCPHLEDLISFDLYDNLQKNKEPSLKDGFVPRNVTKKCNEVRDIIGHNFIGLDIYGIYRKCPQSNNTNQTEAPTLGNKNSMRQTTYRNLIKKSNYVKHILNEEDDDEIVPENDVILELCDNVLGEIALADFLNNQTVREKLAVNENIENWSSCNGIIYELGESYKFYNETMLKYPDLNVWVFSGTEDAILSTVGTMRWINTLNFTIETEWRKWYTDDQVSGFVQKYKEGLVFVTVKGAGHYVPVDQSASAFYMVNSFLNNTLP